MTYDHLHLCEPGDGVKLLEDGDTKLGGDCWDERVNDWLDDPSTSHHGV